MSHLTLHYSTFNESYWERFFTRVLSTPTIGSIVSAFFYKKIISSYTNLLLEISGFQEYTSELDAKSATLFIKRFTKIKHLMSALQANILKRKTVSDEELLSIISKIIDKVSENTDWRTSFMFEYYVDDDYPYAGPNMLAIRSEKYKLVDAFLKDDIDELYDLEKDPGEMVNLINDPKYDQVEQELRAELEKQKIKYKYNPDRDWWLRTQLPIAERKKLKK